MSDSEPIKALIGIYPIARDVVVTAAELQSASDQIDRERARRRRVAEEAQAAAQARAEAAKQAKSWRGWLRAMFGRRGV